MDENSILYIGSLCIAASLALIWKWRRSGATLPFPPGPKGLPLLGNILDVPNDVPIWEGLTSLARKFDTDVLYLDMMTTDMVVLNSPQALSDLSDKRSVIYCDRPIIPMLDLMGAYTWTISLMPYAGKLKTCRRLLHEFLNPKVVEKFDECQRKHSYRLLSHLAESPDDFFGRIKFEVSSLLMDVAYGMDITSCEDVFLKTAEEGVTIMQRALIPGAFLVDTLPILKYVPEWLPGARFKTFARKARETFNVTIDAPLKYVKESVESNGTCGYSIAGWSFEKGSEVADLGFDYGVIRATTGTVYFAGVETTTYLLQSFFLAMTVNPHVVKMAQEELDRVVGGDRMPGVSDQENLPYVSAVIKELLRWVCILPIGLPKRVMEDDIYNGLFIPGGATIIENTWAMFYDESTYPAPATYNPERFLKNGKLEFSVKDPEDIVFGAGRRICPGKHFAMRTLFYNITSFLTVFNIEPPAGEKIEAKFLGDVFVRKPAPFKCKITRRSEARLKLLRSMNVGADY